MTFFEYIAVLLSIVIGRGNAMTMEHVANIAEIFGVFVVAASLPLTGRCQ